MNYDSLIIKGKDVLGTRAELERMGFTLRITSKDTWHMNTFHFTNSWIPLEANLTIPADSHIVETFELGAVKVHKVISEEGPVAALAGRDESGQLWAHLLPPQAKIWPIEECERWLFQLEIGETVEQSS